MFQPCGTWVEMTAGYADRCQYVDMVDSAFLGDPSHQNADSIHLAVAFYNTGETHPVLSPVHEMLFQK